MHHIRELALYNYKIVNCQFPAVLQSFNACYIIVFITNKSDIKLWIILGVYTLNCLKCEFIEAKF